MFLQFSELVAGLVCLQLAELMPDLVCLQVTEHRRNYFGRSRELLRRQQMYVVGGYW
jgi:hypothetical protein